MAQGTKAEWSNLEDPSKSKRILSSGHSVISVRDDIWVIVMTHRNAIIVKNLVIWQGVLSTIIIMGNLDTLLENVLNQESLIKSKLKPKYML